MSFLLQKTCETIVPVDREAAVQARLRLDAKTKPRRSLGMLEDLACRLAAIYRTPAPAMPAKAVVVMAGDHGVTEEGVSAYPAEVTAQMVQNFAAGGAAINVLARQADARIVVVDTGTKAAAVPKGVRNQRLGAGTANMTRGPAMSRQNAVQALETGIRIAFELVSKGAGLIAVGDMGIGNTTAASAITAVLTQTPIDLVTGHGSGIDQGRLERKIAVIARALQVNRPNANDPLDVLAKVGGFEIGGLAGIMLGAAANKVPIILDGFITGASALIAAGLCPHLRDYLVAGHRSVEAGHSVILRHLNLLPLLELDMRLGEGTGAVLAFHLADASLKILAEMATFSSAGVSDSGA
jgi:nicotinate-nucleotide--dimethylbenzimidazole phosphoribosyltransferase